jgi:PAS domain S-box-containing protein
MRLPGNIAKRFNRLDLQGKIGLALVSTSLVVGLLMASVSFVVARQQIIESTNASLQAQEKLDRREIELKLGALLSQAESLASNTVTANALADSVGREIYLTPLLKSQKFGLSGASITLTNYRGETVASSADRMHLDDPSRQALLAMMRDGTSLARVQFDESAGALLNIGIPVVYRLTGNVEGAVVLQLPLASLLPANADIHTYSVLLDYQETPLAGNMPRTAFLQARAALTLPSPLDRLELTHAAYVDQDRALKNLDYLIIAYFSALLVLALAARLIARYSARLLSDPIHKLSLAAEAIAAAGRPSGTIPLSGEHEFDRLAGAFNSMVNRLRESYEALESRVEIRTRELALAQQSGERASNMLREAVASIAQGFTIYDENDRLFLCNETYLEFYETSRDLIVTGASFEEIIRRGAERGQYAEAIGNVDTWVQNRVAQHQNANGEVIEQQLADGRWLLIVEYRTPSGYVVGNRTDVTALKQATQDLRMREMYLRATLDNLPFLFWLKDADGRFLAVNQVFADACGKVSPDTLIGLCDLDIWPKELAEAYRNDDQAVMDSRQEKTVEEPVEVNGARRWIETYKKPVISQSGKLFGTVGFARDVTDRKEMQRALSASQERWELAVISTNDGIWDWNTATGDVYFSTRSKTMLGYNEDELSDNVSAWEERIHPDDEERVLAELQQHLHGKTAFYQCEYRLRCKDGSYKWILARGRASFDTEGVAVRMSGSHTDISEQRQAQAELHDRTEQLNAIFELSPDGFVSFNDARRVKYASPAFTRMTGIDLRQIDGLGEQDFSEYLAQLCLTGARFRGVQVLRENSANDKSGKREFIELSQAGKRVLEVGLRASDASSVSQILYFRDVTHETEVDQMKSEFLSTAAHELRTPMASIYGFAEVLLTQELDDASCKEFLTIIFNQSELMSSILNELLDLARIEARRGKDFVIAETQVQTLVNEVVSGFKLPSGRSAPTLSMPATPLYVMADYKKAQQAILNVLSNAYKYSPEGGSVRIELIAPEANTAATPRTGIRLIDQGIGMTSAQLARVCERFYRADTSGKIPGTGLGMSIVQEIVGLHGGEVVIESAIGNGTSVTIWLPGKSAQADTSISRSLLQVVAPSGK